MSYSLHLYQRKRKAKDGSETADKHYTAQIRFTGDHVGNYLRSTGKTSEREARIEARRIAKQIEEEEIPRRQKEANGILTLDAMLGTWYDEVGHELKSQKDVKWHMKALASLMGGSTEAAEITNKTIHFLVQRLKSENASAWVINRLLERLRSTMRYAEEFWEVEFRKFPKFGKFMQEVPSEREITMEYAEVRNLIARLPDHISLAAAWSYYTGCRLNETATLRRSKIFFDDCYVVVKTKSKKKDAERKVWLCARAVQVLQAAMAETEPSEIVFDLTNRRKFFEAARAAVGRPDFRWHDWRHLTASHASKLGQAHPKLIGKTLGQSTLAATERYLHVMEKDVIELLDHLPDVMAMREPKHGRLSTTAIQIETQKNEDVAKSHKTK